MKHSFKHYSGLILLTLIAFTGHAQSPVTNTLKFSQGQELEISMHVKSTIAQQVNDQAIDFNVDATGDHAYAVTNATDDNTTLHHTVKRIRFSFDGMGQKRSFDSKEEKDLNGMMGKPIKDILSKNYDMVIDPSGKLLMAMPEKITLSETDSRLAIITTMLKDVLDIVQPPQKDKPGLFNILPDQPLSKGNTWTTSIQESNGKIESAYIISDINDSTIVVDFNSSSQTVNKAEMMGTETTTTLNNKSTGKIYFDRATGIMKEKTFKTESNGSTEAPFGTLPVTSKTETTIRVSPVIH
jgi:hypothetical protein